MSASFLVDPGTFPARAEGEPWGGERLSLDFGGETIGLEGLSVPQRETLSSLYGDFVTADARTSPSTVSIFRVAPTAFRKIDTRGWSYELDFDYGPTWTHVTGMDLMGRIEWHDSFSAAVWVATEEPGTFHGAFENFLRVLTAHALLFHQGALVHSAAVLDPAGARLFVGRSGAGKSTVSRLALDSGRAVVSDDLNLIASGFSLAGSPFLGDIGSRAAGSHSLLGIYRLEKGTMDALRPLGAGEALATLAACAPFVNRSPFLAERLFHNLSRLVHDVPVYALTFRRECTFWPLLESC